jgi:hypothetical protein
VNAQGPYPEREYNIGGSPEDIFRALSGIAFGPLQLSQVLESSQITPALLSLIVLIAVTLGPGKSHETPVVANKMCLLGTDREGSIAGLESNCKK